MTQSKKRASKARFQVLNAFLDYTAKQLTRSELLVWLTLYRDTRDGTACSSQGHIALRCGIARKTVERALVKLTERELLRLVYRGGLNRGASKYQVLPMSQKDYASLVS